MSKKVTKNAGGRVFSRAVNFEMAPKLESTRYSERLMLLQSDPEVIIHIISVLLSIPLTERLLPMTSFRHVRSEESRALDEAPTIVTYPLEQNCTANGCSISSLI